MVLPPMAVSIDVVDVADRQAVARGGFAVDREIEEIAAGCALGEDAARVREIAQRFLDLHGRVFWISPRSGPKTLMPSMQRKPVVSISVRVWIGIQKMFAMPGVLMLAFISAISLSQVIPGRHCSGGLKRHDGFEHRERRGIGRGFGLPGFAEYAFTSGIFGSMRSWICRILVASVIDMPGTAVGM